MKNTFTKAKIDTSKYVNIETGELLSDESPEITSVNKINKDIVIISSNEYIIIDSKALQYIQENFNNAESARILEMANMVKGCFNILHKNKEEIHTKESLMEELSYTRNNFDLFFKKLYKKSVIYYVKGVKNKKDATYIMLNPFLARKGKAFSTECVRYFEDISKLS